MDVVGELMQRGVLYYEKEKWVLDSHHARDVEAMKVYNAFRAKFRQCLTKDPARSSRRFPAYVVDMECVKEKLRRSSGEKKESADLREVLAAADAKFASNPLASVPAVRRAYESVRRVLSAAAEGKLDRDRRHVLLLGPPGVGKSLVLSFFDHPHAPLFYGSTTTPKGLVQYLADTPVALLRFDELDKAAKVTVDAMLHILSEGKVVYVEKRTGRVEVVVDAPVVACANYDFARKHSESWRALEDRLIILSMELTDEDMSKIADVVSKELPELAEAIMSALEEKLISLRTVERYLELARAGLADLIAQDLQARKRIR